MTFAGMHVLNFLFAVGDDADTGALDLILRPIQAVDQGVQEHAHAVVGHQLGGGGADGRDDVDRGDRRAAVRAVVGLGLQAAAETEFARRRRANKRRRWRVTARTISRMQSPISPIRKTSTSRTSSPRRRPAPPKILKEVDCVILGYRDDGQGKLRTLILGTMHRRPSWFLRGRVTVNPDDKESQDLLEELKAIRSSQSAI